MQTITFEKLRLKNVRNHLEMEIDFPLNQLTALVGKNGSGKSTIAMALMAGLYGDPGNDITVPDMLNEKENKNMEIIIDFNIDGLEYKIERYYKHKKYSNALILTQGTKNLSKKTTPETYKLIESILVPKDVFCNTVYFAQQVKDFFTALTDSQQKKIFNAILGLEKYPEYYDLTNKQLTKLNEQKELLNTTFIRLQSTLPERENLLNTHNNNLEENKKRIINMIDEFNNDITLYNKTIDKKKVEITQINFDEDKLQSITDDLSKNNHRLNTLDEECEKEKISLKKDFENEKTRLSSITEKKLLANKNKIQELFGKRKEELTIQINDYNKKNSELSNETLKNIGDIEKKYNIEINSGKDKIQEYQTYIVKYENDEELNNIKDKRIKILSKLCDDQHPLILIKTNICNSITNINELIKNLQKDIDDLEFALNKEEKICPTCGQEIKDVKHIKNEIDKKKKNIIELIDEKKKEEKNQKENDNKINNIKNQINLNTDDFDKQLCDRQKYLDDKINSLSVDIKKKEEEYNSIKNKEDKEKSIIIDKEKELISDNNIKINKLNSLIEQEKNNLIVNFTKIKDEEMNKLKIDISKHEHIINVQVDKLSEKINEKKKSLFSIIQKLEDDKGNLINVQNQINNIKRIISVHEDLIKKNKSEIDRLKTEKFDDTEIKKCEKEIQEIKDQINSFELKFVNIDKLINICNFWKEGFSNRGISSMLIDSSIPFMNQTIRDELNKIQPGKFTVSFDTMTQTKSGEYREKFGINILNNYTGASSHKKLSGGEKRIIDVCCMRTLKLLAENLYQKRFNLTVLDEVLDSLDEECASTFCYYLKKLSQGQNIIIMTHSSSRVSEADNILRMS